MAKRAVSPLVESLWMKQSEEKCFVRCSLQPAAVEAAVQASQEETRRQDEVLEAWRRDLEAARYTVQRAQRQLDAADPGNRLVTDELERRWNDKLIEARRLEDELEAFDTQRQPVLGEQEREHLMRLGADLEIAWSHPAATVATRKRIVRAVLQSPAAA